MNINQLTQAHKNAIRAHFLANTTVIAVPGGNVQIKDVPVNVDSFFEVTAWYNGPLSPAAKVYRTFVSMQEIMGNGFDWTRVDNLSVGKARIWDWMKEAYSQGGAAGLAPSKSECRTGVNTTWVGTQADLNVRAAVYAHFSRDVTRIEHVLRNQAAGGTGVAPDATGDGPFTLGSATGGGFLEGNISQTDLVNAILQGV